MIEQLKNPDTTEQIFGKQGVLLDFDKLTVGGHSFGGITALKVSQNNKDVKAVLALDPWYFFGHEKLESEAKDAFSYGKTDPKSLIVYTSTFLPFSDIWFKGKYSQKKCTDNFAKLSVAKGAQLEQIELLGANHSM